MPSGLTLIHLLEIANISMQMSPIFNFIRLHTSQIIVWISIHYLSFTAVMIVFYKMYYRPLSPLPT